MKLAISYFQQYFLTTIRNVPSLFFTLIFPPILLLLFAHQFKSDGVQGAVIVFFNYSVQTVAFMLLGMGVSLEKNSLWAKYLRTLPVGPFPMIIGRLLHTLSLSVLNIVILSCVTILILQIPIKIDELLFFAAVAIGGAIPMAMMGITIGYIASPESCRSIFTLLNLLLLVGSFGLPDTGFLSKVKIFIPSYEWSLISYSYINKDLSILIPFLLFFCYFVLFLLVFIKIYRRQNEG